MRESCCHRAARASYGASEAEATAADEAAGDGLY